MELDLAERVNFLSYVFYLTAYYDIDIRHEWPTRSDELRRDAFYLYALFCSTRLSPARIVFGCILAYDYVIKRTSGEDSIRRNLLHFPLDEAAALFARALQIITRSLELGFHPHAESEAFVLRPYELVYRDLYVRVGRMCLPLHHVFFISEVAEDFNFVFQEEVDNLDISDYVVNSTPFVAAARKIQACFRHRRARLGRTAHRAAGSGYVDHLGFERAR